MITLLETPKELTDAARIVQPEDYTGPRLSQGSTIEFRGETGHVGLTAVLHGSPGIGLADNFSARDFISYFLLNHSFEMNLDVDRDPNVSMLDQDTTPAQPSVSGSPA